MIRDEIKEQQEKLKDKSPQEKFKYFVYYYKFHVLIAITVVWFIIYAVSAIIENSKESSIYIALLNTSLTSFDETSLLTDYVESRSIDTDATPAVLDTSISFESVGDDLSLASFQKLMSLLEVGELDVLVCEEWLIKEYSELGAYENLETLLPADLYEIVKENLYYAKNADGQEIPVAFYVNENAKIMQGNTYPEDAKPVLAISSTSTRKEQAVDFIRYLYE